MTDCKNGKLKLSS